MSTRLNERRILPFEGSGLGVLIGAIIFLIMGIAISHNREAFTTVDNLETCKKYGMKYKYTIIDKVNDNNMIYIQCEKFDKDKKRG